MALLRMSPDTVHPLEAMMTPITADPMEQYERMQVAQPMARPANQGLGGENEPGHAVQMSPFDPYEEALRTKQMSDIRKDQNPYGSPDNHPGILGKILHGLSVATGGPNRRQFAEEGREKQIAGIESEKSKNALEGAQAANAQASAGKTNAETPEVAPNAESARSLQGAEAGRANAQTQTLENPPEEWKAIPSILGPNGEPVEIEARTGQVRFGGVQGAQQQKQPKPDTPEQQYIDEYQQLHKGSTVAEAERAYVNDTQKPPQAIMLVPGANGGYTAQNIRPGSNLPNGAISPAGMNSMNVPDSSTRTMVANAPGVLDLANRVNSLIDEQTQTLGPAAGRWNDFMTGKVGAPNPEFKKLLVDTKLLKTKLMRMHVGARGGEYIMQSFNDMLDAGKDSPENLKAAVGEIINYAQELQNEANTGQLAVGTQGSRGSQPETKGSEPQRPANVPSGYTFNAHGPKGAGWYAPTAK